MLLLKHKSVAVSLPKCNNWSVYYEAFVCYYNTNILLTHFSNLEQLCKYILKNKVCTCISKLNCCDSKVAFSSSGTFTYTDLLYNDIWQNSIKNVAYCAFANKRFFTNKAFPFNDRHINCMSFNARLITMWL